jgi:hypothetical protein
MIKPRVFEDSSGCAEEGYRKDRSFPTSPEDYSTNSVVAAPQLTFDMENNEYQIWLNKLASVGVAVGPSFDAGKRRPIRNLEEMIQSRLQKAIYKRRLRR